MKLCTICGRNVLEKKEYCRYHQQALENLTASYEGWKDASGVSWEEYIERLSEIEETGRWIRDMAEQIRSEDGPSART